VAPGEQQPESDHGFKGEGADAGINQGRHWRHASAWFSYELKDADRQAKALRLSFSTQDAGRRFRLLVNGRAVANIELGAGTAAHIYTEDFKLPPDLVQASGGKLTVRFEAEPGSVAGGLYGVRLLR
jgi:hypothetical protein